MKILNESIIYACKQLNIDSRDIVTNFQFDKPELHLKKKIEIVKDGHWKKGERHWYTLWLIKDDDVWVDTSYTKEVIDINTTRQNAIKYINNSAKIFRETIKKWQKSIEKTESKLYSEIENRRSEYKARINQTLDSQTYQQIGKELEQIAETIKITKENQTQVNATCTDVIDSQLFTLRINKELLPIYKLSEYIRIKTQYDTFNFFIGKKKQHSIIGWDENCEAKFLRYAFNQEINPNTFVQGINIMGNSVYLIHKPKSSEQYSSVSDKGIYILVNATQIGSAMSEISHFKVSNILKDEDDLYFVIQDFNEIMNGNSVSETLDNILGMKRQLSLNNIKPRYLLLHDNPIFNLAAIEAQTVGCTTQFDEIRILNDLQKKFNFLLPQDKSMRNIIETTIHIIIQKLGKI